MLLCTKIRLQMSEADAAALEFMQGKCRGLYNWWVMRLRDGEQWPGWVEAKATLEASKEHDPELRFVYGKLLHEIYFRLDKAMSAFFRRIKVGVDERPGFPRVRPRHAFFTLCYPAMYIKVEGDRLYLPTGGGGRAGIPKRYPNIVARLTEPAPADYREVAISRDARGHYYAAFVAEEPDEDRHDGGVLAIDLGIKTLATGVNEHGRVYTISGFKGYQWYNRQLDKIRSKRDHCHKKSRRYVRLSQVYRRVSERKRNKQRDCLHKASHLIAYRLVESTVVIGDLSQRQMVTKAHKAHQEKNRHLHRAVFNDWGLYGFVRMLEYKCPHAGKKLEIIEERHTTHECCWCHHRQAMPLWRRTYRCGNPECLAVLDCDVNSAINIRERFLARLGPHTDESVRCAAPQAQ
ncbi:MAG TPA: transposase [Ktedonobacterales bacterium]|nr:transposase [Ktedonobacterales bacterium]